MDVTSAADRGFAADWATLSTALDRAGVCTPGVFEFGERSCGTCVSGLHVLTALPRPADIALRVSPDWKPDVSSQTLIRKEIRKKLRKMKSPGWPEINSFLFRHRSVFFSGTFSFQARVILFGQVHVLRTAGNVQVHPGGSINDLIDVLRSAGMAESRITLHIGFFGPLAAKEKASPHSHEHYLGDAALVYGKRQLRWTQV